MFVLNLGVSFFLSLHTALRAYGFPRSELAELAKRLFKEFARSPGSFFLPLREATAVVKETMPSQEAAGE